MTFYESHLKTFQRLLKELNVKDREIPLTKGKKYCFDIYVIDMQNGFMDGGECGVMGSSILPEKIIGYLDYMLGCVNKLNQSDYDVKIRFVFSRDYHHPEHKSFQSKERPTGFPAHCQYGTFSSMIHFDIMEWIKTHSDQDITITFKAFHPDIESFSTLPYTAQYEASERQGTCCETHKKAIKEGNPLVNGGGVYFPEMKLEELLRPNPFALDDKFKIIKKNTDSNIIKENAQHTLQVLSKANKFKQTYIEDTIHHSFVAGLAGDFCVRDTLINSINQRVLDGQNGESCLIYNLTAYVTLPIGTSESSNIMNGLGEYVTKPQKEEHYYVWVTPIKEMLLDYIEPSRGICMKPPIFMVHQDMKSLINDSKF